eukprot:35648-Prymnesium_polylepis.1
MALAGSASGYALTFDGRGTDVASTLLSPELFDNARGLTATAWIRSFGLIGRPYRQNVVTFLTPEMLFWFLPFRWNAFGDSFITSIFDTINPANGDRMGMSEFYSWRHVAVTWTDSGLMHVYLDGEVVMNKTGIRQDQNVSLSAARGVYMGVG